MSVCRCDICGQYEEDCCCAYEAAQRYADALIAIVGLPWDRCCPGCWSGSKYPTFDPDCHAGICPWLIAARALGIHDCDK